MPITHVQVVSVYVRDQDKALDFYTNTLGFEKVNDEDMGGGLRWVEVVPPGAQTHIVLASGYGHPNWESLIGGPTTLVFEADDIQGTYEDLKDKGVRFTEAPTMQPWGMMQALFEDPEGNGYVLVQRPSRG